LALLPSHSRSLHAALPILLPALLLLGTFTHWPALATFIDSFYSTPRGARAAVWVGIENYRTMVDDPVFWKAVKNNLLFAGATIPDRKSTRLNSSHGSTSYA